MKIIKGDFVWNEDKEAIFQPNDKGRFEMVYKRRWLYDFLGIKYLKTFFRLTTTTDK